MKHSSLLQHFQTDLNLHCQNKRGWRVYGGADGSHMFKSAQVHAKIGTVAIDNANFTCTKYPTCAHAEFLIGSPIIVYYCLSWPGQSFSTHGTRFHVVSVQAMGCIPSMVTQWQIGIQQIKEQTVFPTTLQQKQISACATEIFQYGGNLSNKLNSKNAPDT